MDLKKYIKNTPDFPIEGVMFRDITPILYTPEVFDYALNEMIKLIKELDADFILAPESRGFIFGTPIANKLNIGFIPVRKPGKLPRAKISSTYDLEYGSNTLEIHKDDIKPGQRVVIVDDLLATGGTIEATIKMVEQLGSKIVGCVFLINLKDLGGLDKLKNYNPQFLIEY